MSKIVNQVFENNLNYNNTTILTYKIEFPQLVGSPYDLGQYYFNVFNRNKAISLKNFAETELFQQAKESYDYNSVNDYPIMVYEVISSYNITCLKNNILSLYTDEYQFTGGAHGNTLRTSQNWNLQTGKQFSLSSLFPENSSYLLSVLKQINSQIKERLEKDPSTYFENYCELVIDTLKLENFYLIPEHIVIFFNQYDIAPYSTGIPTFEINYKNICQK